MLDQGQKDALVLSSGKFVESVFQLLTY